MEQVQFIFVTNLLPSSVKADPLMVPLILKYNARETTILFTKMNYLENLVLFSFQINFVLRTRD